MSTGMDTVTRLCGNVLSLTPSPYSRMSHDLRSGAPQMMPRMPLYGWKVLLGEAASMTTNIPLTKRTHSEGVLGRVSGRTAGTPSASTSPYM